MEPTMAQMLDRLAVEQQAEEADHPPAQKKVQDVREKMAAVEATKDEANAEEKSAEEVSASDNYWIYWRDSNAVSMAEEWCKVGNEMQVLVDYLDKDDFVGGYMALRRGDVLRIQFIGGAGEEQGWIYGALTSESAAGTRLEWRPRSGWLPEGCIKPSPALSPCLPWPLPVVEAPKQEANAEEKPAEAAAEAPNE
jgi:hypothetical protein